MLMVRIVQRVIYQKLLVNKIVKIPTTRNLLPGQVATRPIPSSIGYVAKIRQCCIAPFCCRCRC